ncbi:MAG: hypothetical protein LQ341_007586, partial [Variospora aurantia]
MLSPLILLAQRKWPHDQTPLPWRQTLRRPQHLHRPPHHDRHPPHGPSPPHTPDPRDARRHRPEDHRRRRRPGPETTRRRGALRVLVLGAGVPRGPGADAGPAGSAADVAATERHPGRAGEVCCGSGHLCGSAGDRGQGGTVGRGGESRDAISETILSAGPGCAGV